MNPENENRPLIERLRTSLEGARYGRSVESLTPRSRGPLLTGVAGVVAVVTAGVVVAWPGTSSATLAWSPTPSAATDADETAARTACSADFLDDSQRYESISLLELPPLVALDLRGTGGLATFSDDSMTLTCLLVRDGDGFERGPIIGIDASMPSDPVSPEVVAASSTEWDDGRMISMIVGTAPTAATSVEIAIADQETATATVTDGLFAMWWFGSVEDLAGTVTALDVNGASIGSSDLALSNRSEASVGSSDPTTPSSGR